MQYRTLSELLRVSRHAGFHNRIRAGVVHDRPEFRDGGWHCLPACPQMDIITSWDWMENRRPVRSSKFHFDANNDSDMHSLLYRPQLSWGNMKLVRLIMKRPEGDVSLSMVSYLWSNVHPTRTLAHAPPRTVSSQHKTIVIYKLTEIKKSRCSNHRPE